MRYFETPHFQRFSRSHIGAREFVGYQIQIKKIFADVREKGRLERTLFTRDGGILHYLLLLRPRWKNPVRPGRPFSAQRGA